MASRHFGPVLAAALLGLAGCAQQPVAAPPVAAPQAAAQMPATPASVERLLAAMNIEQMMEGSYAQVGKMAEGMAEQMGLKAQDRPAFDRFMQRVTEVMHEEAGWAKLKGPMVEIYTRHYSEEEVQGLIAFYESPLGRSMVAKTPAVMRDSAAVSQEMMKRVLPRIMALAKEMQPGPARRSAPRREGL